MNDKVRKILEKHIYPHTTYHPLDATTKEEAEEVINRILQSIKGLMPKKKKIDERFNWTWQYALNKEYNKAIDLMEETLK